MTARVWIPALANGMVICGTGFLALDDLRHRYSDQEVLSRALDLYDASWWAFAVMSLLALLGAAWAWSSLAVASSRAARRLVLTQLVLLASGVIVLTLQQHQLRAQITRVMRMEFSGWP